MPEDPAAAGPRTAVVTGAASGIGAATARLLAGRGWSVVVTDRDVAGAAKVAADCGGAHLELDVTDPDATASVCDLVTARWGGPHLWVSNAGISRMGHFTDTTPADLEATLAVNLKGPFYGGQVAARSMIRQGIAGVIVNVASMAGKQGRVPYLADYVASKFAVVGLTQAMAFELAPHGIRVNCVCPGYVATPMQERETRWEADLRGSSPDAVVRSWIADTPLGRIETPDDVARAVGLLVGADAAFITGEALAVNGGAFMD